jgi:predicted dehydrogenase
VIRIGLIGAGYWGPNLARVLNQSMKCDFTACADLDQQKLSRMLRHYPTVKGFASLNDGFWDHVDAVLIATPISTHYKLANESLQHGKHTFVEKPLCTNSREGDALLLFAKSKNLTLMTGHTFLYSPAVRKVREQIVAGNLGDINYITLSRMNLGLYQKDVDVIWDLAVHDISILLYWLDEMPSKAASFGRACVQKQKNDVAFLWLQFPSGIIASIEISWLSPQKMRRTCVVGSKRMIVYDDADPNEKIKIYDKGVDFHEPETFGEFQLTYRTGDMLVPNLSNSEPLLTEVEHFIDCIETGHEPTTSGEFGNNVVRVLEMMTDKTFMTTRAAVAGGTK